MALHTLWKGWTDLSNGATIITNSHSSNSRDSDQGGNRGQGKLLSSVIILWRGGKKGRQRSSREHTTMPAAAGTHWALAGRSGTIYQESHAQHVASPH